RHLIPATIDHLVPGAAAQITIPDTDGIIRLLEHPDQRFGPEPSSARDHLLLKSLATAWAEAVALMGPEPASWAWGHLHSVVFEHPISPLLDDKLRSHLNIGPAPRGGSGITVNY